MRCVIGYTRALIKSDYDDQIRIIEDYCDKNNTVIDTWFDINKPDLKFDRKRRIEKFKRKIKKRDTLIASEYSRLGNSLTEIFEVLKLFEEKKVNLIIIKKDSKNPFFNHYKEKLNIFKFFSEVEQTLASRRSKEGLAERKKKGKKIGNPNLKRDNIIRQKKALEFAEQLRGDLEHYINSGLSQRAIVKKLNESGIKTRKGGKWTLIQLQTVLKRLGLKTKRTTTISEN